MEKNYFERFQAGEIPMEEFQRLNVIEVLDAKYHEIMAPESYQYLKALLVAQAPTPQKMVQDILQEIDDQREEILKAFLAKHGCGPDEAEQVEFKNEDGMPVWRVRRIRPGSGVPLPMEIVDVLRDAERALLGADACPDPECGSDQCSAYQQIVAMLPPHECLAGPSHKARKAAAQAARPSLSLEQAGLNLQHAIDILGDHVWDGSASANAAEKVLDLVKGFRDRWFNFHEQSLKAMQDALPREGYEGITLVEAVQKLAMRLKKEQEDLEKLEVFIGDMLPKSLKHLDGKPLDAVGAMGLTIVSNIGEINDLRRTLDSINASGTGSETLAKINEIVQRWYAGGVAIAIESAPSRMAEIGTLLNARAAALVAESRAQDKAEAEPVPFGENGTCLTCGLTEDEHTGRIHAFRPKDGGTP